MKEFFNKEIFSQQVDKLQEWMLLELPVIIGLMVGLFILLENQVRTGDVAIITAQEDRLKKYS